MTVPSRLVFTCFLLSGATGLVYQVIWLRMLNLVFGHTVYAITTVLAAFMGGLALGSFVFGRLAHRIARPVRVYGVIEIAIGLYCAAIPLLLGVGSSAYVAMHRAYALPYDAFNVVQFVLVFALLLIPTALMGGTLPVLSQAFANQPVTLGRKVGALYTINTVGAVVGVALTGYLLLPALGTLLTVGLAAAANLTVGVLALAVSRGWTRSGDPMARPLAEATNNPPERWTSAGLVAGMALGVSGAISMVYEVAWTRALALVIGSSTYAFSAMLLAFLIGIAAGSALYTWVGTRYPATIGTFAFLQAGIGLAAAATVLVFEQLPHVLLAALQWSKSPAFVQWLQVGMSTGVLLASTLFIGATLPCAVAIAGRASHVGRDVGRIYASNTIGAILGTVAGGYVLIPRVGLHPTLRIAIAANLGLAALVLVAAGRPTILRAIGITSAALAAGMVVLFLPPWDRALMTSGPAIYAARYRADDVSAGLKRAAAARKILFYRDGASGTIAVHQEGRHRFLTTNGKIDAGTAIDMATQLMSGHLPMLVHPAPRRVAVIGMGSGVTAGAVISHPVTHVDVVEIEPAVVEAARLFAAENRYVLDDPRVRVIVADGRNFLLTARGRYDVIISEPSNPWIGGLASLFSTEFFQMARERLERDGIMLQWVQGYHLAPEDLRMVVNTFRSVFPATTIWSTLPGDFLLLGQAQPRPIDVRLLRARYQANAGVFGALGRLGLWSWPSVLSFFMLDAADTAKMSAGAGLNTDDRLPLEFSAPRALYDSGASANNLAMLRASRTADLPDISAESRADLEQADVRFQIGLGYYRRRMVEEGVKHLEQALRLDPTHTPSLVAMAEAYTSLRRPEAAFDLAMRAIARDPLHAEAHYQAALAAEALGKRAQARAFIERAVALDPAQARFRVALQRLPAP